ncbi:hypothetical protein F511_18673 [Dorcoceras hygrometricum]|uniref:Uncharacterized protein n=1 Tax=Dorcoceras hygrometricum TaxID=472368 RepID=A0A2Z7BZF6_9LAMI|nr:hypothetical protein F511_18673 [Dorcoceras hygrometricum]
MMEMENRYRELSHNSGTDLRTENVVWSRHEDIQTGTVRGSLSWIGRRYLAGTVRGRPSWYNSLFPEVQGTQSWFIGLEQEQHEDQAQNNKEEQSFKRSWMRRSAEQLKRRLSAEYKAAIECEAEYKRSIECRLDHWHSTKNSTEQPIEGPAVRCELDGHCYIPTLIQNNSEADQLITAQLKSLLRYREQIVLQLVKDKPAGQDVQEQIKEEETLSSKVMNSHKMC